MRIFFYTLAIVLSIAVFVSWASYTGLSMRNAPSMSHSGGGGGGAPGSGNRFLIDSTNYFELDGSPNYYRVDGAS